jgi:hypothetical protein
MQSKVAGLGLVLKGNGHIMYANTIFGTYRWIGCARMKKNPRRVSSTVLLKRALILPRLLINPEQQSDDEARHWYDLRDRYEQV